MEVERILNSKNHFERLQLGVASNIEPSIVRQSYKIIALQVHPDKCLDPKATEAFQLLSEAFELLYDKKSQRDYFLKISSAGKKIHNKRKKKRKETTPTWQKPSWEEVKRDLKRRKEQEEALREKFVENVKSKFNTRKVLRDLITASRACEDLDARIGISESQLWPLLNPETLALENMTHKLSEILTHLRGVHMYCIFCGIQFESNNDIENNCPGPNAADHES